MRRLFAAVTLIALMAATLHAESFSYPSASSTIVGSLGFIDSQQVGYFWDASRGDSVTQTFASGLPSVSFLRLDLAVPFNALSNNEDVTWNVLLNNVSVGGFVIPQGFTGNTSYSFSSFSVPAASGNYTVRMAVTDIVGDGSGSHTFAYAGSGLHLATLAPEPSSLGMLACGALAALVRRKRS